MGTDLINKIYDILETVCDASPRMREAFLYEFQKTKPCREWRFSGNLGFGGKFRLNNNGMYVDYYSEDETTQRNTIEATANEQLNALQIS